MHKIFKGFIYLIFLVLVTNSVKAEEAYTIFPFKIDSLHKYGFIDKIGRVTFEAEFDQAEDFKNGIAIVRKGNFYGFINNQGKLITPQFTLIKGETENLILVQKDFKWGYVNKEGDFIIQPKFDEAYFFSEGLAKVFINKKYGYINLKGELVITPKFDYAESFSDGLAQASFEYKDTTFIDKTGKFVIRTENDYIYRFSEGLAPMLIGSKYGYVDKTGKKVIQPQFEQAGYFHEGLAPVKIHKKWGFIDKVGNFVLAPKIDEIKSFSEGFSTIRINKLWGYINKQAKIVIEPKFEETGTFSEGLAPVKVNQRWGYIDKTGEFKINPIFDNAKPFIADLALVNNHSYINQEGEYVWTPAMYVEKKEAEAQAITIGRNLYQLKVGSSICINHWSNANGFCGIIKEVKETSYIISIKTLNCNDTKCLGACSNKIITDSMKNKKSNYFIENEIFLVEIPKDCITSVK